MSFITRKKLLIFIFALVFFTLSFQSSQAAGLLPGCIDDGSCGVCDMVQVVIDIGVFMIGVSGAITLAYIVYGGYILLTSAGSTEKVGKGKKILINSAIGLAVAFSAYLFITTFVSVVSNNWSWEAELTCFDTTIKQIINFI